MGKSILHSLFGLGKLLKAMVPILRGEGIVLQDEGVTGSVTLRKFRAPGRIHSYKRSGFVGSIVVTESRFAAFSLSRPIINVPLEREKLKLLELSVPRDGLLLVKFEAGDFHDGWKGTVECRFSTHLARMFLERTQLDEA